MNLQDTIAFNFDWDISTLWFRISGYYFRNVFLILSAFLLIEGFSEASDTFINTFLYFTVGSVILIFFMKLKLTAVF